MSGAAESKMAKSDPPTNQDADPSDSGERPVTDADAVAGLHPSSDGHDINDAFSDTSAVGGDEQPSDLKNDPKACSCSCHTGSAHCMFDEKLSESIRFRELLILHLDMIEEQSALLQLKEKQLFNLKIENEQLNARLNRMERRVTLKVRKHTDDTESESTKGKTPVSNRSYSFGGNATKSRRSSVCGSCISVNSRQFKDVATGNFLATDVDYLKLDAYESTPKEEKQETTKIAVPTWKDIPIEHSTKASKSKHLDKNIADGLDEITDDESYQRRHLKMELDEIRRKRWDIQQMRQERIHENLRQKQREREEPNQEKGRSKLTGSNVKSLHPSADNAMVIEFANEIPVFALGSRIPHFEPSEFDLPWFDVAKREIQHRQKRMKSARNQRRKTWYKV